MDYRKFLGKVESEVLPYFGGATVDAASRRLRVSTPPAPGWWRFDVQGRTATAREPAEPQGLDGLPLVRGHLWGSRLVREGAVAERVQLLPEEEPPRFSPMRARRWHDGTLVFEGLEFEGEAEGTARLMVEEGRTLAEVKAVPASLRAAFGYAVLEGVSGALGIRFAPAEVRGQVLSVAEQGRPAAEACLRRLAAGREAHVREMETRLRGQPRHPERQTQGVSRVERALESAGARLLATRRLGNERLEVTFGFMDERFISIVETETLQVVDAGICLAGSDRQVTLESLPSVIREAIQDDVLVITRHA
ncbi:hypothetical protein [Archangium lipolyticum]|uniref:hypothetical protein n=1 Tax=Archangium lipolyticum TaxID=2970465 RepID=UPI00214A72DA|nr:hypothetical protein [Archangium lipolyticum]